jgi:phospholipid/cholesterol/gamma-HCH transport system permease protein
MSKLVALTGPALARFGLVRDQILFLGNYSLAIIAVSGLFVGFVMGLQGYYTLQRYGSETRWACWSTWRWCANWARC